VGRALSFIPRWTQHKQQTVDVRGGTNGEGLSHKKKGMEWAAVEKERKRVWVMGGGGENQGRMVDQTSGARQKKKIWGGRKNERKGNRTIRCHMRGGNKLQTKKKGGEGKKKGGRANLKGVREQGAQKKHTNLKGGRAQRAEQEKKKKGREEWGAAKERKKVQTRPSNEGWVEWANRRRK